VSSASDTIDKYRKKSVRFGGQARELPDAKTEGSRGEFSVSDKEDGTTMDDKQKKVGLVGGDKGKL